MPIAALEAIGCGAPVLLSDISANKDIGLPRRNYFPVTDGVALRACLKAAHENYAVDRKRVLSTFDWDRIAAQTLKVYDELMDDEAHAPVFAASVR